MPVGVIQFDEETTEVEWFNPFAELIFTNENGDFEENIVQDIIQFKRDGAASQSFDIGGNKYSSYLDLTSGIFYFFMRSFQVYNQIWSLRC